MQSGNATFRQMQYEKHTAFETHCETPCCCRSTVTAKLACDRGVESNEIPQETCMHACDHLTNVTVHMAPAAIFQIYQDATSEGLQGFGCTKEGRCSYS